MYFLSNFAVIFNQFLTSMHTMVAHQTRDLESIEPTTGCLINGLYLEGAAWCGDKHCLIEMENGRIHNEMATVREYFTLSSQVLMMR